MKPMIACGHQAQSQKKVAGEYVPACVIDDVTEQAGTPNLEGRQAKCYCGTLADSTLALTGYLAFFEYKGEGSHHSVDSCAQCPYTARAHNYGGYFYPGVCPQCDVDALFYMGNEHWTCQHCAKVYSNEQLEQESGRKLVKNRNLQPHNFEPHGAYEFDSYYCGHAGWD